MASTATIEELAQQLTEVSDKFVESFTESMTQEDELNKFLRGRQRWYVGTKGGAPSTGSMQQPERSESSSQAEPNQPQRKKSVLNLKIPPSNLKWIWARWLRLEVLLLELV